MTPSRLIGPVTLTNGSLPWYFAPDVGNAVVQTIVVQNTSGSPATFTFGIGADSAGTRLYNAYPLAPGQVLQIQGPFSLSNGEFLQAYASAPNAVQMTVSGMASSVRFPLTVEPNGRFLQQETGEPFLIKGMAAWEIFNDAAAADVETLLSSMKSQGFNTAVVQVTNSVKYVPSSVAPAAVGAGNALPWLKNTAGTTWTGVFANADADWSTPNDNYFNWVAYVYSRFEAYGIAVISDWAYYGFNLGVADGWYTTIGNAANTQAVMQAFGAYLAKKVSQRRNIIWSFGTDTFPAAGSETSARIVKMFQGWTGAGGTTLALGHYQRSSGSHDEADFASFITIRGCYPGTDNASTFATDSARVRHEYQASPTQPTFSVESNYSPDRTDVQLRLILYHAWLAGIAGYTGYGQDDVYNFVPGWQSSLAVPSILDLSRLWGWLTAHTNAHLLVPDADVRTIVTAGGGTPQTMGNASPTNNSNAVHDNTDGNDYVAAAVTPDGSLLAAYVPDAHTGSVTVAMTKLRGTVTARWFDPTSATYTAIGSFPNTGTHAFTIPGANSAGNNDWLLELDA